MFRKGLAARGANVEFYDPHVPVIPKMREHGRLAGRSSITWTHDRLRGYDAVLITTDHDAVDYRGLCRLASLIVDTRNACAHAGCVGDNVVKA